MNVDRPCALCGGMLDPLAHSTLQRVVGWQRKSHTRASGKHGGSDIFAREPRDEFAHKLCVERRRQGIAAGQGSLV